MEPQAIPEANPKKKVERNRAGRRAVKASERRQVSDDRKYNNWAAGQKAKQDRRIALQKRIDAVKEKTAGRKAAAGPKTPSKDQIKKRNEAQRRQEAKARRNANYQRRMAAHAE